MPKTKAPKGNTSLALYDERLAALAKQSKKAVNDIGTGGNFLSFKGGNISYQNAAIPGNVLKVIVLDWCFENQFYADAYDETNPSGPACYAFAHPEEGRESMAPNPENVPDPQNPTCDGCPHLEWGSAEKGRGKACSEVARLALISEADFEDIENASIAYAKVSVTSMKYWAGYVKELDNAFHHPSLAFITELRTVPQAAQPGWHLEFKMLEHIEGAAEFEALFKKYDKIHPDVTFPYPKFEAAPEKPARRSAPARKPAAAGRFAGSARTARTARPLRKPAPAAAPVAAAAGTRVAGKVGVGKSPRF